MWKNIGKILVKVGLWALGNSDELIRIVEELRKRERVKAHLRQDKKL